MSEINNVGNRSRLIHLIVKEDKHSMWKLLHRYFSKKKLRKAGILENYDFIDLPSDVEDRTHRSTPPLLSKSSTIDLILYSEDDVMFESEATSPTFQSDENVVHEDNPTGPSDPVIPDEGNADRAAADEEVSVTFEAMTSSASSSSDNEDASPSGVDADPSLSGN